MKFYWFIVLVMTGAAILIKENSCVPAIRPLSQRGILFPVDNWDDCFLDETGSTRSGLCKKLEECPEVFKKWNNENIYPKTCYFLKKEHFVCCPIVHFDENYTSSESALQVATEKLQSVIWNSAIKRPSNIFLNNVKGSDAAVTTKRPSNIFLDKVHADKSTTATTTTSTTTAPKTPITKRPSNIFLDMLNKNKVTTTTATSPSKRPTTKRPSNIFLDNLTAGKKTTTSTTTKKPIFTTPDIFNTAKPSYGKRRSEIECDLQNHKKFETIDEKGRSPESTEFPYMAVLGWKSSGADKIWYPCGGVLVSPRFVLTAAHCAEIGGETPSFVRLGDRNLTDSEEDIIKIERFIAHPSYNLTTFYNDVALVELKQEVSIPMVCLWTQHNLPITKLTAVGYGRTRLHGPSNQLFKASLNLVDKAQCQEYFKEEDILESIDIVDSHLCAGDVKNAHSTCQGDTGGPLLMQLNNVVYVVGITTFGLGCADLPPSIYTRISSFIDWIEPIIWSEIDVRFDRK